MKVKPLGDRILVQRVEAQTKTKHGIYLPETAKEKPQQAKVLAVGDGKLNVKTGSRTPVQVKPGDTILLSKWGGSEIKIDGKDYVIVNEDDIMGVVE
jgi:chaperonin GroES